MKAAYLVKNGNASKAFEIRETDIPEVEPGQVRIKVEAFGLNFADVMARLGMYPEAPPKPGILGYDVVGYIDALAKDVDTDLKVGDRVTALTRFGGYAEYACTDYLGVAKVSNDMPPTIATALATQGGTAFYMAHDITNIYPGDHVLVHAAAGGVGSLLCQMAKAQGATVYGTASTPEKLAYVKSIGVDHPINYKSERFDESIRKIIGEDKSIDLIFDAVGGSSVKRGMKLLGPGGRMMVFGAASLTSAKNIFSKAGVALGFGLYHPIGFLSPSKSLMGINMLAIADHKSEVLGRVIRGAVDLYDQGIVQPLDGGLYPIHQLAEAHDALGSRKTMGKVAVKW